MVVLRVCTDNFCDPEDAPQHMLLLAGELGDPGKKEGALRGTETSERAHRTCRTRHAHAARFASGRGSRQEPH